jgi:hypothetical protein
MKDSVDHALSIKAIPQGFLILPIFSTTEHTFLVEIQKVFLFLPSQVKRTKALLRSNLLGINLTRWNEANVTVGLFCNHSFGFMP